MSRTVVLPVLVNFGDCDPAGIVFYPNYLRWMDAASQNFFKQCGVPPWRELERTRGIIGPPVLETSTRYFSPSSYGDEIEIHTSVSEWRAKVFIHRHKVMRGETLLCEASEVRAFVSRDSDDPRKIKAIPVPEDIKALCS